MHGYTELSTLNLESSYQVIPPFFSKKKWWKIVICCYYLIPIHKWLADVEVISIDRSRRKPELD